MIIGITMQHPTSVALAPIDHGGEQTSTIETGESAKESKDSSGSEEPGSSYPFHEEMRHTGGQATMLHAGMNGVAPLSHVYVSDPVALHQQHLHQQHIIGQLEAQFAHFGVQEHLIHSDHLDSSGHNSNSDNNNAEDLEGEETDDEPVKLFVGQVPKTMNEEEIFPTFDAFGPLKDVAIIRDKHTGLHRGCAFVTYWSSTDAERARESLHDKYMFPGAKRATQVKPAEPSVVPENKLFIGMLSRKAGEQEVRDLFSPFGEIREVHMIRNADGSSKCAAFLRYVDRESAAHAIEQLNGNSVMEGAARPLIVKFADNKHQRQQRHIRNIRRQEMMAMLGPAYPYHPQGGPPPMMHMHPVTATPQFGMPPPPHFPAGAYAQQQGHPQTAPHPSPYLFAPPYPPPAHFAYQSRPDARPANSRPREGPSGANLFVYHLPHDLTDADLATAFNHFGNVISAKVYVDKYTGESKGFGFVSYDSMHAAEAAIEQMNGFQIGNKRLKVQHKRIHGGYGNLSDPQSQMEPSVLDDSQLAPANV